MKRRKQTLLLITACYALAAGCGPNQPHQSLDRALLPGSQLPSNTPPQVAAAHDGNANSWVRVVTPDPAVRSDNLARLKDSGFKRGSVRQYRASGSSEPILGLIQAVAEVDGSSAARQLTDSSFTSALRKAESRGGGTFDPGTLGDFRRGLVAHAAGIPVYSIIWQRGNLVYYLSVVANANGGPSQARVITLAHKLDQRHQQ